MRTLFSFAGISLMLVVLVNCSPKTSKSVSSSSSNTTSSSSSSSNSSQSSVYTPSSSSMLSPDEVSALKTEYSDLGAEQLAKGRIIFESSCKKCHTLYQPASRNAESWMNIMRQMGPKAKLSQDHYKFVSAYLVSAAK